MEAETRYAKSGELSIAYQVHGEGPVDLLLAPGYLTHLEQNQWWPGYEHFLERLRSFSRLILFDRRGTGLSDRILALGSFEELLDDIRAVLDATSSEKVALVGQAEGGPMCALFAATFPERTSALVLNASYARRMWAPDYPWGLDDASRKRILEGYEARWGSERFALRALARSMEGDAEFRRWYTQACRFAGTPGSARAWFEAQMQIDIREVLPAIRVPTLIVHRIDDPVVPIQASRHLAENISGAKLVELPGEDHFPFVGDADGLVDEVEEFLTGSRPTREPDRVLATVLFTDIVGSTEHAAELGDRRWTELLAEHHRIVRAELDRHRGKIVRIEGDGALSTFDGPARAVNCATAILRALTSLGLEIRAGLHTGEIELAATGAEGIAVHIGARVASLAAPGEVLTSSTVKDLVVGSGIAFVDRGTHALKGVPGEWQLYAVDGAASGA
ncbi:MAG TPA: adenylate/guanylate cyclase domain-containing protein [Gaiellaceae bacterium]